MVGARLLVPVIDQPYCIDNEDSDCAHFLVAEQEVHPALWWPDADANGKDNMDYMPEFDVRQRSSEIKMWVDVWVLSS